MLRRAQLGEYGDADWPRSPHAVEPSRAGKPRPGHRLTPPCARSSVVGHRGIPGVRRPGRIGVYRASSLYKRQYAHKRERRTCCCSVRLAPTGDVRTDSGVFRPSVFPLCIRDGTDTAVAVDDGHGPCATAKPTLATRHAGGCAISHHAHVVGAADGVYGTGNALAGCGAECSLTCRAARDACLRVFRPRHWYAKRTVPRPSLR
jgi:hypothetical protein